MKKPNQKGISLIQTLVIIGIIGIVVLASMILLSGEREKTRNNIRVANTKQIQAAIELFYSQNGSYPATATAPTPDNSGHNWLPNIDDHGIQNEFKSFLSENLTAPLPADSSTCRAQKPCNNDQSSTLNDFCYTAYPEGCSSAGDIKCNNFSLDFCISKQVRSLLPGKHSIDKDGMR